MGKSLAYFSEETMLSPLSIDVLSDYLDLPSLSEENNIAMFLSHVLIRVLESHHNMETWYIWFDIRGCTVCANN